MATSLKRIYIVAKDNSIRFHRILNVQFDFLSTADFISGNTALLEQRNSKDSDKIMFHSTFRHVPEAFYRIRTLNGSVGIS